MDRNIISLIGIADALKHLLENDSSARKNKETRATCKRLEKLREELLTEGVRYSQIVGAARDSLFDVTLQLSSHLTVTRGMEWVVHGLQSIDIQDVQPPPLPPSSSSGPQSVAPGVVQLAQALVEIASSRSEAGAQNVAASRLARLKVLPTVATRVKNGPVAVK